jgi:PAS domain S-box-containing protein
MLKIYTCIATAHDLKLVVLAAIVCSLSSFAAIRLLRHARAAQGQMRQAWLAVSAVSIGFGIWATHFIAMLAFTPGIPSGYNIGLTFLSLVAAILLTGAGLAMSMTAQWRFGPWIGGAIVGGGIAAMHYTGMAAFEIAGIIVWDPALVAVSIILGAVLGAVSLPVGLHDDSEKWKAAGAILLTLAICSHHFTAMAAAAIIPDPSRHVSLAALPAGLLAIMVCGVSFTIILIALTAVALDIREKRRGELEADRMNGLANAAVEGLVVCDGDIIVTVNNSFASLVDIEPSVLVDSNLTARIPDDTARVKLMASSNTPTELSLRHQDGSMIPVEMIRRPIDYAGRPHHVIAVRDLRARKKSEQHIRYLAHHDALTTLPNRSHFTTAIDRAIDAHAGSHRLAVLCLDLDRFK